MLFDNSVNQWQPQGVLPLAIPTWLTGLGENVTGFCKGLPIESEPLHNGLADSWERKVLTMSEFTTLMNAAKHRMLIAEQITLYQGKRNDETGRLSSADIREEMSKATELLIMAMKERNN